MFCVPYFILTRRRPLSPAGAGFVFLDESAGVRYYFKTAEHEFGLLRVHVRLAVHA